MRTRNKPCLKTVFSLPAEKRGEILSLWTAEYFDALGEERDTVICEPSGKPVFARGESHLSVTHTGPLYAAVFAPFPVGLDGEKRDESRPRVAARYFTEAERRFPFARVWTAKEAVAKLVGEGLSAVGRVKVWEDRAELDGKSYALQYEDVGEHLLCLAMPWEVL